MAKLIRAILIDSINQGSCIDILLDANVSITGTNGIGKTSFFRLLAVFYGVRPGLIVKADGNNLSFGQWYLPRPSSYIIFEYENHEGGLCCAVMHHSSGAGGYGYRLISGPWTPELVYVNPEVGLLVAPGDLIPHATRLGRTCTPELNQTLYRLVIQYNTVNSNLAGVDSSQQKQLIQHYRPRFSLAPRRKDVAGIDTITLTLIENGNNYDALRKIIADILQQENDDPTSTLESIQPHEFRQLRDAHEGCSVFESELVDRIGKLDSLANEYTSKATHLRKSKRRLELIKETALDDREQFRGELDEHRKRQQEFEDKTNDARNDIDVRLSAARADFQTADRALTLLDGARSRYESQNIADAIARCDRMDLVQADLKARQQELEAIDKDGADIRATYTDLITQEKDRFQNLIDAERDEAQARRNLIEQSMRDDELRWQREVEQLGEKQNEELAPLRQQLVEKERERANHTLELEITRRTSALPEDQAALDKAREALDNQQAVIDQISQQEREQAEQERLCKESQQSLAEEQSRLIQLKSSTIALRDGLIAQLNASDTTLVGFLRKHRAGWENDIGRLLPPSVLMRDDLNPELSDSTGSTSLYGVTISLDRLTPADIADADKIRALIAEQEEVLQRLVADESDLAARQSKLAQARKRLDIDAHQLRLRRAEANDEMVQRRAHLEGIRERAADNHHRRCEELDALISRSAIAVVRLTDRIKAMEQEHGRERLGLRASMEASKENFQAQSAAVQEASEKKIDDLKRTREVSIQGLERKLDAALADKGIDALARRQLLGHINELKKELAWLEQQLPKVEAYRRWLADEWALRPERARAVESAEAIQNRVEREKSDFEERTKRQAQELREKRTRLNASLNDLDATLAVADRVLNQLIDVQSDPDTMATANQTAQDIEHDVSVMKAQQNRISKEAGRLFDSITGLYTRRGLQQSPHAAHIDAIARQARQQADDLSMAWLYSVNQLASTANEFHQAQREKLIILAQAVGDKVCDSRGRLDTLHKSILALGREATKRAKMVAESFASLDIDEVRIQSQIHNLEFWSALDAFEQQYKRWRGVGDGQLPSAGYMEAVARLERLLANGQLSTRLTDCFTLEVSLYDSGRLKTITSDSSFKASSSEGLKVLLQAMLFVSLFELLRDDANLQIVFPLDETLRLSSENYIPLLKALNERQIVTVAGFPEGSPEILAHFKHNYEFFRDGDGAPLEVRQYLNASLEELDSPADFTAQIEATHEREQQAPA